ncbi:MAG TPA: ABC transporter ATP-binding protein [Pseudolabrys sp.]|nr:ABC transporter ATP-binding protein [Pseudolabrys sp.]
MTMLRAERLTIRLRGRPIVDDASIMLRPGELTALVGPNGAGKTTLMRALAGLLPASDGRVMLKDRPLADFTPRERARSIAYLPQGHFFHWPLDVASIVALGRHPHADPFSPPTGTDRAAVAHALAAAQIEDLADRIVTSLSGGERARVALARVLATEAEILFADEPTASLDPRHQLVVMGLLRGVAERGGAVLAIVHDLALAARFASRVVIMQQGRIVADASPAEALSDARLGTVFGIAAQQVNTGDAVVPLPLRPL